MILMRLKALLDSMSRRFEMVKELRDAPRGSVRWSEYATGFVSSGKFLSLPCEFPDLREDRHVLGAIRCALEKQLASLESQRVHGSFVHRLIDFCAGLLQTVQHVPKYYPSASTLISWLRRPMTTTHLMDGVKAIEWTLEERGLAGVSDLEGIPWTMPMEAFFEAWVESVFGVVARQTGGNLRAGRLRETVHALSWDPPYLGSQKSMIPDLWLEWSSTTLIIDAKYKRHWEELERVRWVDAEQELREQHRQDLFQVLAYANLCKTPNVITCLAYPCSPEHWENLVERGRCIHRAEITVQSRSIQLWMTAVPMATSVGPISRYFSNAIRPLL